MTRAILIDPFTETIIEVMMVDTKLQTIKNLMYENLNPQTL